MLSSKKPVIALLVLMLVIGMSLAGCGGGDNPAPGDIGGDNPGDSSPGDDDEDIGGDIPVDNDNPTPIVEITMEDGGVITLELDRNTAPITVANFIKLVNEGFYDGLTFHRVMPEFMIQGGSTDGRGLYGSDETIIGEFSANGVENNIDFVRGVIGMARTNDGYDTASSQFFITNYDSPHLNGKYAAFGHVISGMDVVDRITAVPTGQYSLPVPDAQGNPPEVVVIKTIRVIE